MILDWEADPAYASLYDIVDADTGESLPMGGYGSVFYADDDAGILRLYLKDEDGKFFMARQDSPETKVSDDEPWTKTPRDGEGLTVPVCLAWREEKRRFRIVRKREENSDAGIS